jgi:hypothetical protein
MHALWQIEPDQYTKRCAQILHGYISEGALRQCSINPAVRQVVLHSKLHSCISTPNLTACFRTALTLQAAEVRVQQAANEVAAGHAADVDVFTEAQQAICTMLNKASYPRSVTDVSQLLNCNTVPCATALFARLVFASLTLCSFSLHAHVCLHHTAM